MHNIMTEKEQDSGRYTSEKAALQIGNLYDMVLVASMRAREMKKKKYNLPHRETLAAIKEVEEGKAGREYLERLK